MNKLIIFCTLIYICISDKEASYFYDGDEYEECEEVTKASVENCNKITISDKDYKCCYESYKDEDGESYNECEAIKKSKAKKVKELFEDLGFTDVSVDCSSNYLSIALIVLLSLLF